MKANSNEQESITIRGKEIKVNSCSLSHLELRYYPENPRIYSLVTANDREPTQEKIEEALIEMDHVKQLVQSIKANGGLTDPILVRDADFVVLEGNSRLAAYRILFKQNPLQWSQIKVKLLPRDIAEDDVFALLGEYHIIGKKDWAPYEQAGYLYRRHKRHAVSASTMAREMGISTQLVERLIEIYKFMIDHDDDDVQRWSYYEEYLRHRVIQKAREEYPNLDKLVVKKIKSNEIPRAIDVREKLTTILKHTKTRREFALGKKDFSHSYDSAQAGGADNSCFEKMHRFREWIVEEEREEEINSMSKEVQKKCFFEIKKVNQRCEGLLGKIKP